MLKYLIVSFSLFLFSITSFSQGLQLYNNISSYSGYTLYPHQNKAYLIYNCGKLINEWTFNNIAALSTYLMPDGNIFWMGALTPNTFSAGDGSSGNLEIRDPNNNLVWSYAYYSPNNYGLHHDSEVLPNGNILLIAWEQVSLIEAINIGRNPNALGNGGLWTTKIVEL